MNVLDFIRVLCLPLVPVYMFAVFLRNALFSAGIFSSRKVKAGVVSVGNISLGGSGKTPMVIFIAELLKLKNLKPGVLSRGYGRSTKGYVPVSDGEHMLSDVQSAGDEIFYTSLECKVPASVSENRVKGAERLIEETGIRTLVLDDAFQHRWIARDVDLVVIDQRFLMHSGMLRKLQLPTGDLREPLASLNRADCVAINRKFSAKEDFSAELKKYLKKNIPVFSAYYKPVGFIDVRNSRFYNKEEFQGQKSLLVSGVANPRSFVEALDSIGIDTKDRLIFQDHKNYTNEEVQGIRKEFYARNSNSVITTQKDAVKLASFGKELDDIDIYYLKIELDIDERSEFEKFLLSRLKNEN